MGLRTVGDPFGGPARLVDKLIGEAYSNVKLVADNMAAVIAASAFAAAVAAAASAAATSASTATSSATTATTAAAAALVSNTAAAGSATAASGSASGALGSAITASTAASGAATSAASAASSLASLLAVNPLSTTVGTLQTIASPISVNGTFQSNGTLGVANTINLGTGVGAGGTTTIQTPNGSHINLSPQGSAHVKISGGNGTLDTGIINIGNITFPIASGNVVPILSVAAGLTGNITQAGYFGWNTISASSDDAHCTGSGNVFNDLFIAHNFGGPNYRGFRQGLAVSFTQTADITSSSGFEVISGAGFGVNLMKTWGGTGLTIANARGYATCLNPYLTFGGTFTNGGGGSAMEIDVSGHAGSSFLDKVGLLITLDSSDTVQGTLGDAALTFANQTIQGAGRGWKALISVGSYGGYFAPATDGAFWIIAPNSSGDTLVVNKGLSWANGTFTTSAIETPGFTLSGVGKVTLSSAGTALAVTNNATIGGTLGLGVDPTTPLQAATKRYVDARSFNLDQSSAVGDGTTDDVAAIQTFLNNLASLYGGAEVKLTPGKFYYIGSAPLTVPTGIILQGAYNAQDNQGSGGTFFGGGGFIVNPALAYGIIMSAKTTLKNFKVYRSGLIANASAAQVTTAQATWAAEAFYRPTNGTMATNSKVIPLASTTGITVGMAVSGVGGVGPGGNTVTVASIITNTSVTITGPGVNTSVGTGIYFRFGGSIAICLPYNGSGSIIDGVTVVGFRTGVQAFCSQFWISHYLADCITCFEATSGGDTQSIRDCEFLPLYGTATGLAPRPGDAVFLNGPLITQTMDNVFSIGWLVGYHIANAQTTAVNCGTESFGGPGSIGWWLEGGSQSELKGCHSQGSAMGFYLYNATNYLLSGCTSAGSATVAGDNIAHFFVDGTVNTYGAITEPQMLGNGPSTGKIPIKFGTTSVCSLSHPMFYDMVYGAPSAPFIQGTIPNSFTPEFVQGVNYYGVSTGATATLLWYWSGAIIDSGSGTLATCTIVLPVKPIDGQLVRMWFNVAVTALTISTTDGAAVGNIQNPVAGTSQTWIYKSAQNKWFG